MDRNVRPRVARRAVALLLPVLPTLLIACGGSSSPAAPPAPVGRLGAAAAFDEARRQLVLFGGTAAKGGADLNDTWTWDVHGWTRHQLATGPSPRSGAAIAYDPETGEAVLVGGRHAGTQLTDTWLWNGKAWKQGGALTPPPAGGAGLALAYDPARTQLVATACCGGQGALTYSGDGTAWSEQDPARTAQPGGGAAATAVSAAFAPVAGGHAVLVASGSGAAVGAVVSEWDGIAWKPGRNVTDLSAMQAPAGSHTMLAESPDDGDVLAVVQQPGSTDSLLRWNGSSWVAVPAGAHPLHVAALATDIRDGEVLLVGGDTPGGDTSRVLAWYGGRLGAPRLSGPRHVEPTFGPTLPPPTPRVLAASAYAFAPADLGPGFHYAVGYTPGPLSADVAGHAASTWEAVYDGPGSKRVVLDVYEYGDIADAVITAGGLGLAPVDHGASQLQGDGLLGDSSWIWQEPVSGGRIFYAVVWREGPLVFSLTDRDDVGAITPANATRLARIVDAKTH